MNIVSQIPAAIWQRELPTDVEHEYVHTGEPVQADIHVVYGLRSQVEIPNRLSNAIFVASEPPEIREYHLNALRRYRRVLAPAFPYLSGLPNFVKVSAIAPWWVGTHAGGREHYDEQAVDISLTRDQLASPVSPTPDRNPYRWGSRVGGTVVIGCIGKPSTCSPGHLGGRSGNTRPRAVGPSLAD